MRIGMFRLIVGTKPTKTIPSLHTACYFADITAVGILLDRGMDVNVKNDDGDTPLCVLARCNPCLNDAVFADIAGLLLSKGARVPRSGKDTTALIEAVRNRHFLMADILLESGTVSILPVRAVTMCCTSSVYLPDSSRTTSGVQKDG